MFPSERLTQNDGALVIDIKRGGNQLLITYFFQQVAEEDDVFCTFDGGVYFCFDGTSRDHLWLLASRMKDASFLSESEVHARVGFGIGVSEKRRIGVS